MPGPVHRVNICFESTCGTLHFTQRKNKRVTRQTGSSASRIERSEALVTWSSLVRSECFRKMVFFFFFGASMSAMFVLQEVCVGTIQTYEARSQGSMNPFLSCRWGRRKDQNRGGLGHDIFS